MLHWKLSFEVYKTRISQLKTNSKPKNFTKILINSAIKSECSLFRPSIKYRYPEQKFPFNKNFPLSQRLQKRAKIESKLKIKLLN